MLIVEWSKILAPSQRVPACFPCFLVEAKVSDQIRFLLLKVSWTCRFQAVITRVFFYFASYIAAKMSFATALKCFATIPSTFGLRSSTVFAARTAIAYRGPVPGITLRNFGRGQGDAGGWPSTTGNPSGSGRSNKNSHHQKQLARIRADIKTLRQQLHKSFHGVKKSKLTKEYKTEQKQKVGRILQSLVDKLDGI